MNAYSRVPGPVGVEVPIIGYGSYHRRGRTGGFLLRPVRRALSFMSAAEWLKISLAFATMGTAIYSLQRAKWIGSQPSFVAILMVAMLTTAILIKINIKRAYKVLIIAIAGGLLTAWQSSRLTGGQSLLSTLSSSPNQGTIHFAVFIILLSWLVGALTAWLILRKRNAWIPAGIGTAIVLLNLSNLPPEHYNILPIFLLIALFFIGLNSLLEQRMRLSVSGGRYPRKGNAWFMTTVLAIAGVAVAGSSLVPEASIERIGFDASGQFLASLQKDWFNIFASVPGKWNIMRSEDLKSLSFASPVDNRDTVLFVVTSTQPAYWRINRYDNYSSWGWTSNILDSTEILKAGAKRAFAGPSGTKDFSYTVESRSKTDVMLLAGEFVSTNIPVKLVAADSATPTPSSSSDDILAVNTPELMQPYQRYTAVVNAGSFLPSQLSKAGTLYPAWVASRYLQVPLTLPSRVRQMARTLTQSTSDPYDKALAIQDYLHTLKYNKDAKSPSRRGEETDSFLFIQKEGVCTDFATAMVVMLRTQGIPARLATGYLPGLHETGTDTYTIRGKDYHAWPEVYFPNYGWVQFEPTPRPEIAVDVPLTEPTGSSPDVIPPEEMLVPDGGGLVGEPGSISSKPKANIVFPIVVATLLGASLLGLLWTIGNRVHQNLRRSSSAAGVYQKMCRFASLIGIRPAMAETPLEYTQRLSMALPEGSESIDSIGRMYTETSYSPKKDLGEEQLQRLQKSWVQLYPLLFKRRLPWNR